MNHLLGAYSSLIIPGIVALVLILIILKVVSAVLRLLSLVLLIAVLAGGYIAYGRLSTIQKAVDAATAQGQSSYHSAAQLAAAIRTPAQEALAQSGLNPADVNVRAICVSSNVQVQLRYDDPNFLFGALSQQWFDVPTNANVRC